MWFFAVLGLLVPRIVLVVFETDRDVSISSDWLVSFIDLLVFHVENSCTTKNKFK